MTDDEREAWWDRFIDAETVSQRSQVAEAILDRVEQLERDLATARADLATANKSMLDLLREETTTDVQDP